MGSLEPDARRAELTAMSGWTDPIKPRGSRLRSYRQPRLCGISVIVLAGVLAASILSGLAAANTDITDLGTLPGHFASLATGINAAGQVVGGSLDSFGLFHAFVWEAGIGMRELPPLAGQRSAIAFRINDAGQAVGLSGPSIFAGHAVLWAAGGVTDLGTLPQDSNSSASDINATGSIVGVSFNNFTNERAVLWQNGGIVDLGLLGSTGISYASGLNDMGQIVGSSSVNGGGIHAALWQGGSASDLGTLPGDVGSSASDVNNAGVVIGISINNASEFHAFRWTAAGGMSPLGALPGYNQSVAAGINETGDIVGESFRGFFDPTPPRAFLWHDGNMTDLGVLPGGSGSAAYGINGAGKIVGEGSASGGIAFPHAVLWTPTLPVEPLTAAVSAPQSTDVGLNVTFQCTPAHGVPPYQVTWDFGDGTAGSGESTTHAYATPGQKTATCTVTDNAGTHASSTAVVEVFALPSIRASANRTATSPNMPVAFTAAASEGTGGYSYEWTFGDGSAAVPGAVVDHTYRSAGRFNAEITVRDSVGGTSRKTVTVDVASLSVTAAFPTSTAAGKEVSGTATATGGAGGYTFHWDFGDGTTAEGPVVSHAYNQAGTYSPTVTVTDGQGVRSERSLPSITVQGAAVVNPSGPVDAAVLFLLGGVILIAVAVGAAILLAGRRRPRP